MTNSDRALAIQSVINAYIDLPDTPPQASARDYCIATKLIDDGFDLDIILRAIKIGFVRRWARDHSAGPLPPIRSLAYFKAVLTNLSHDALDDDYALFIDYKFAQIRPDPIAWVENQLNAIASHAQNCPK
jgi:hypothetical protein